jgi:hypothetical protein
MNGRESEELKPGRFHSARATVMSGGLKKGKYLHFGNDCHN